MGRIFDVCLTEVKCRDSGENTAEMLSERSAPRFFGNGDEEPDAAIRSKIRP